MERRVQILDDTFILHKYHFILYPYQQLKDGKSEWYSPPMYTHPGKYKFCINVTPNGYGDAKGTHLSVFCVLFQESFMISFTGQ